MELLSLSKEEPGRREFFDRLHESLTTPVCQGILLAAFGFVIFFGWHGGMTAIRTVFGGMNLLVALLLSVLMGAYALSFGLIPDKTSLAVGILAIAVVIGLVHRPKN